MGAKLKSRVILLFAAALIQRLGEACKSAVGAELTVHVKAKAESGGQQMDEILSVLKESDSEPLVGILAKVRANPAGN